MLLAPELPKIQAPTLLLWGRQDRVLDVSSIEVMQPLLNKPNVVIMDKGNIIAEGSPAELKSRYTGKKLIWYTAQNEENTKIIETSSAPSFSYEADHYNILMDEGIMEFIWKNKDSVRDFEVIKGTMDDVFLTLTGKEMVECNG